MSELKKKIIIGSIWSIIGQLGSLTIVLFTNILLSRLLSPREFGQVGVIMFFITIGSVLTESGLSGALVRKKEATELDYSTVFVSNLVFSVFCFLIVFFSSNFIAGFYNDVLLKKLLIVSSFLFLINAFQIIQNAKIIIAMRFKEKSIYRFFSVLISSIIGIYFAYQGLGVWSLVLIQLLTVGLNTIFLWVFEGFFLNLHFSKDSFKTLYSFGINTTFAAILNTAFENIYQLVLAKYFSLSQTGYFFQAKKLQDVPGGIISMVTQSVIFSSLAKLQDDKIAFSIAYNKIALYFLVLLGLISSFIYIYAEPIILLLYGKKWLDAVFYMELLTIASFFYMQELIIRVVFKVFDRTRQILYLESVKKIIQAITIVIGVYYLSLKILIMGFVLTSFIGYLFYYYLSLKIKSTKKEKGLIQLIKVSLISFICVSFTLYLINHFSLTGVQTFLTLPFVLFLFIAGLYLTNVINVKNEFINIIELYKKNN